MSAILELKETPESCYECDIVQKLQTSQSIKFVFCGHKKNYKDVSMYTDTRHPDCPLKIVEDNLRWITANAKIAGHIYPYACPSCNYAQDNRSDHCPHCGIKLLPPIDK